MLLRTRRSRPVVDASDTPNWRSIGGGLQLRGVGRWDGTGVVSSVDDGGRGEL